MKHWGHTLATYVYNHCNICNIPIYFCNNRMKHLQHIPLKHLKHLKCALETCIVSQCGLLRCLHRGAVAVALSDIYQGPTLLLVLVAPVGIFGHEHARNDLSGQLATAALARRRLCRQAGRATEQAAGAAEQEQCRVTVNGKVEQNRGEGGRCGVDARGDGECCISRYAMGECRSVFVY
jgi:hypothetical protein